MIVYQHIIHLWVLIIKKKPFALDGLSSSITAITAGSVRFLNFWYGSPFLHQDDGAILDVQL